MNNLYVVKNKQGQIVPFKLQPEQADLYSNMWYLNLVLKARQLGLTTIIQLFMLDRLIFNNNLSGGVIAHNREDAQKFFDDKIKLAYDHLPPAIHSIVSASNDNKNELKLSNGSSIRVGTSMRSGTYQYLHVSEFGKICAKYPDKAKEIVTGALNTVAPGQFVFIESTAEGAHGYFHDMCRRAERMQQDGIELTKLDYKFFFYPWWRTDEYTAQTPIALSEEQARYFGELEADYDLKISNPHKWWYIRKAAEQGDAMGREYPSVPDDAFRQNIEGAIFGKEMSKARREGRVRNIPHVSGYPVYTFWDLGRNDTTAIWFMQSIASECRFIDFYESSGESLDHYARTLQEWRQEKGYIYGDLHLPHDALVTELTQSDNLTRQEVLESHGFKTIVVPRIATIQEGIELSRQAFSYCWFDKVRCAAAMTADGVQKNSGGIEALENYRFEWDEKRECYRTIPLHNWASNGADAFRQFAQGFSAIASRAQPITPEGQLSRSARRKKKRQHDHNWVT